MRGFLFMLAGVLLALGVGYGLSGANLRDTSAALRADTEAKAVISLGPVIETTLPLVKNEEPTLLGLRDSVDTLYERGTPANRVIAFARDRDRVQLYLALTDQRCIPPVKIPGSFVDKVLLTIAADKYRNRDAVLIFKCVPGSMPT